MWLSGLRVIELLRNSRAKYITATSYQVISMKLVRVLRLLFALSCIALVSFPALRPAWGQRQDAEREVNALLARMTLAEKLGQLPQLDGEGQGNYRPEHLELVRKGLLGSTLNVRGAARTNELQRAAIEQSRLKIPVLFGFDVIHGRSEEHTSELQSLA